MKQIQIIGHLGKDAEVKNSSGTDYTVFSVAVTEKVKGEDVTTWFDCFKYSTNDNLRPYLTKGSKVFIQGAVSFKTAEKDGKTYVNVSVNVDKLQLIGQKQEQSQPTSTAPAQHANQQKKDEGDVLPF